MMVPKDCQDGDGAQAVERAERPGSCEARVIVSHEPNILLAAHDARLSWIGALAINSHSRLEFMHHDVTFLCSSKLTKITSSLSGFASFISRQMTGACVACHWSACLL